MHAYMHRYIHVCIYIYLFLYVYRYAIDIDAYIYIYKIFGKFEVADIIAILGVHEAPTVYQRPRPRP